MSKLKDKYNKYKIIKTIKVSDGHNILKTIVVKDKTYKSLKQAKRVAKQMFDTYLQSEVKGLRNEILKCASINQLTYNVIDKENNRVYITKYELISN